MASITFTNAGGITTQGTVSTPSLVVNGTQNIGGISNVLHNNQYEVPTSSAVMNYYGTRTGPYDYVSCLSSCSNSEMVDRACAWRWMFNEEMGVHQTLSKNEGTLYQCLALIRSF